MKKRMLPINNPVIELTRRLSLCKGISASRILLLVVYYVKLITAIPFAFFQSLLYSKRISKTAITQPPIFILGHYRSGTTYLQKSMSADPSFGFINGYDTICPNSSLLFGKWLQKFLQFIINTFRIKNSFFNNSIPDLDDAAEEERFLVNKGSAFTDYWRFVFPLCWSEWQSCSHLSKDIDYCNNWKKEYMKALKLISFKNKGRQLVLKSPPNTERIRYILEMFPGAKFIYISRNPYHVFYSTCNMWKKAIKRFYLQKISNEQMEELVFKEFIQLAEQYQRDKKLIPPGSLIEVLFEDLEQDPMNVLENIYAELELPDFEIAKEQLLQKLYKEKKYQKFDYVYQEEVFKKIDRRWGKYIHQWKCKESELVLNN